MKKIILGAIASVIALSATEVNLEQFKELSIIKQSKLQLKKAMEIGDNWYYLEAVNRGTKIGIYTDKNKVIIGRGFYSETGEEIKFDIDFKKYKDNALLTIGNGTNEYFLFTDPECPYCKMLDEKLTLKTAKEKLKIHTYFYPLEFHLLANAMSVATIAQPKNARQEFFSSLMSKDMPEIIKETDKYSSIFYKDLIKAINEPKYAPLLNKYIDSINRAYGTNVSSPKELKDYCENKLKNINGNTKAENELFESLRLASEDFEINGTPTLFDSKGNRLENPYSIFMKHGIVDINPIKEIEKLGMTIQMGDNKKEKLYIFSSTKCPNCIDSFKDQNMMKKLEKYNVNFVLMDTGSNPELALKEAAYLLNIKDTKKRFDEFKRIMEGGSLLPEDLNSLNEQSIQNKMKLYMKHLMNSMVQSTPLIVNSDGVILENIK
jgi:thiol:disulfide interchange protein DsbC